MHQECIRLLEQMVAIPSESGNEKQMAEFVAGFLEETLGMQTELQTLTDSSCNVVGRWRARGKRRLLLGGHIDTVAPSQFGQRDPYRLVAEGDRLRGLGSCDMKGGLAAQLIVLKRLREERTVLDADVEFVGLADEERYSAGAHRYVELARQADEEPMDSFFIMGEPHYDNLVVGAAGKVLLAVTTTGKEAQAAAPENGINAVDAMVTLLNAVNKIYSAKYRNGECASHCCLRIESAYRGYSLTVPAECRCWINKQLKPDETVEEFVTELYRQYDVLVRQGSLQISQELPSYPAYQLPPDEPHVAALRAYLKDECRREPVLRVNQGVSDANLFYTALQIPTVLFGPYGEHFHTEQEYVSRAGLDAYMKELLGFLTKTFGR